MNSRLACVRTEQDFILSYYGNPSSLIWTAWYCCANLLPSFSSVLGLIRYWVSVDPGGDQLKLVDRTFQDLFSRLEAASNNSCASCQETLERKSSYSSFQPFSWRLSMNSDSRNHLYSWMVVQLDSKFEILWTAYLIPVMISSIHHQCWSRAVPCPWMDWNFSPLARSSCSATLALCKIFGFQDVW